MSMILNGKFIRNDLCKNAKGGTELQAELLIKHVDQSLLKDVQIHISRPEKNELDSSKKQILWCHDLANDPEVAKLSDSKYRERFDKLVFVSNWQLQQYNMILGVPYKESIVIQNSIEPLTLKEKKVEDDTIRIIYHTNPNRGLNILVPVFEKLSEYFDNIYLDVYSSFQIYGWKERDKPYEELFERCKSNPRITYHGTVDNASVRKALTKSHIFAYPSIWPETSAISVIEAMYAGNIVVCPNYAALPETSGGFALMYQWSEDMNEHAYKFFNTLYIAINELKNSSPESKKSIDNFRMAQYGYCDMRYNFSSVGKRNWENLLREIKSV